MAQPRPVIRAQRRTRLGSDLPVDIAGNAPTDNARTPEASPQLPDTAGYQDATIGIVHALEDEPMEPIIPPVSEGLNGQLRSGDQPLSRD